MVEFDKELVREAKAIVALAFRNGPIKDLQAGMTCPTCANEEGYSRVTDANMKKIMKNAVSQVFRLLWMRDHDPEGYQREIRRGDSNSGHGDDRDVAS
ncbi:MAG: hypothetical protein AABX23_03985 [Nanoarchaeota archaeon]